MKLLDIKLENFRAYGGVQKADFSTSVGKNVSTFYGTNGGGKTTLLNACLWALYGKLTEDLEDKESLINAEAWIVAPDGEDVSTSVVVRFEHDGKTYRASRRLTVRKRGNAQTPGRESFDLNVEDGSGVWRKVQNASSTIDKILPSQLSGFFFINGERIEYLAKQEAYSEIQSAIKTVLGIEPLVRAKRHLPSAVKKMRHKLKSEGGAIGAIEKVNAEIDRYETEREEERDAQAFLKSEIGHLKDEIVSVETRLRTLEGAAAIQKDRDRVKKLKESVDDRLEEDLRTRNDLVRQRGYLAFLPEMSDQIQVACEALRKRGDLPAPLKRTFVKDLLEEAQCICGTHLPEGSPERARIEQWLDRAGLAEVEAAWARLQGSMGGLEEQRKSAIVDLESLDSRIAQSRKDVRELNAELDEFRAKLKNVPDEDIAKLEASLEETGRLVEEKNRRLGAVQARIKELDNLLRQKAEELDTLQMKDLTNQLVQKRIRTLQEAEQALQRTLDLLSEQTRRSLDSRIRRVFEEAAFKDYVPELTSDFVLELWVGSGDERRRAPKSTGENMLLALAFVAALAEECRHVAQNDVHAMSDMSDFPVVMDAAFGNLDVDYRRRVATFLPEMASQVIVLTHKAQSEGAVEEYLAPRVGQEYVITAHSRKSAADVTDSISVNGRGYPYQVVPSSFDGAVLTEVEK
ncbi:AAA family ATPase [Streptomyces rubiginosohelvolus]|uniref:AAA family ATPase n=1 Tax=Streptomyces rubiginosohelvolus TaxID=67362 RepID=UPI0036BA5B24